MLHGLYLLTPEYFDLLGTTVPSYQEVFEELVAAEMDRRRHCELLSEGQDLVGYLDWTTDYPGSGDLTVNLLLVATPYQRRGLGSQAARQLEERAPAGTRRILASVYGSNGPAAHFWERRGYRPSNDCGPAVRWYTKILSEGERIHVGHQIRR